MKERRLILLFFLIFIISYTANSQNQSIFLNTIGGQYYLGENNAKEPCISKQQYEEIEKDCANNIQKLGLPFKKQKGSMITTLSWPLKAAPGLNDCSFYVISAHVDQDFSAVNFKDYNCGTNTYDGHKGTDIATFPFGIYKIDHDEVQVIAAAAGTIINKTDGNFDKNCASNNLTANSIVIQHADGSTALYLHMKKNSLTSKGIGASIAVGEFLGIVGSSGNSTGPHLHFEVWSGSTSASYIDPFSGTCNLLNTSTWWVNQKPYTEPEVVKVSVNTTDIVIPGCPATETPNEANCFTIPFQGPGLPAGYAKFYIFFRNETQGMTANMSILNPDGSTFNSWTYNSISSYNASWRTWSKVLPTIGGTYTFKASYNGLSCEKKFDIVKAVITPGGSINICQGSSANLQASLAKTYLWSNGDTTQNINVSAAGDYKVTITNTYGCTSVSESVNVKVNQSPVAVITSDGPTIFCDGGTLKLSANSSSSYKWSTGETTQSINVTTSGAYKVTITNSSACTAASNPINVTINLNPIVNISPTGPISFCEGGIQKLSSSLANSYLWSNGDTTQNINVSASGNYKVTVTSSLGCSSISKAVIIKVNPNPIIKIGPTGPTSFCPGDFVELVCDLSTSYKWNTGATSEVIFADTAGAYSVTVTDQNGCFGFASINIFVFDPQNYLDITIKNDSLFSPYGSPSLWYIFGNATPVNSASIIKCDKSGTYYVTGPDIHGCMAQSDTISVICNSTATNSLNENSIFTAFPNPFIESLHVFSKSIENGTYKLELKNLLGQTEMEKEINIDSNSFELDLNLKFISNGFYILCIGKGTGFSFLKLLKTN